MEITKEELIYLKQLEVESIHIFLEVAAEFSNPVMMYSAGKNSSVMYHLAMKTFIPAKHLFKFLHVDTLWKFYEMIEFRDNCAIELGFDLVAHSNTGGIAIDVSPFEQINKGSLLKLCMVVTGQVDICSRLAPAMEWYMAVAERNR